MRKTQQSIITEEIGNAGQPASVGTVNNDYWPDIEMALPKLTELRGFFLALVLGVSCTTLYAPLLFGQSDELTLKTNAASRRAATGLTIEKLIDLGRLPEARAKLQERFAKEGERPRLLLYEAMILYREKQYIESVRKLERSLSLHDGDPDVYKLIGLNLVSVGRAELAEQYFEKAVALAPRDFMARYYLGLYHLTSKQADRAEAEVRERSQAQPQICGCLAAARRGAGAVGERSRSHPDLSSSHRDHRATTFEV